MNTELEQVLPAQIEKRSFEIITEELGDRVFIPGTEPIVKRCIHTSADLTMRTIWSFPRMWWKRL